MRRLLTTALMVCLTAGAVAQNKLPQSYKEFYKDGMKKIDGDYPVYKKENHYYLEVPAAIFGKDVLVMSYIRKGYLSEIAKSSGIIRFSKGINNSLNVVRIHFSEGASSDVNGDMEPVLKRSGLQPVNYAYPVVANGKKEDSYIIDITRQIMESGDWFAFPDITFLSHPDPERTVVENIALSNQSVRFTVERSQTDFNQDFVTGRDMDNATTFELELLLQQLPEQKMARKPAEKDSPFETFTFMDYGKAAYTARKTSFIRKWNRKQIVVALDPDIPAYFMKYIEQGVLAWNEAFGSDMLKLVKGGQLGAGQILVNWGNTYTAPIVATVEHPETGEILAGRINITEAVTEQLMRRYLLQCGAVDKRIIQNIKHPEVQGEILRWLMIKSIGKVLGLRANFAGSYAYTTAQLRNPSWLKTHAFSASIMDDLEFNYVAQPADGVPLAALMPRIGEADIAAIKWGYGLSATAPVYQPEDSLSPVTQHNDLASDKIAASQLGIKNLQQVFIQLDSISKQLDGTEDLFNSNGSLYGAAMASYEKYCYDVAMLIGSVSSGDVKTYTDAATQRQALAFLQQYVFNGPPEWMKVNSILDGRVIKVQETFGSMQASILTVMTELRRLDAIIVGNNGFSVNELFSFIDKEVFMSFNKDIVLTPAARTLQATFVYELAQAALKANITGGLNDANVLLHYYLVSTVKKVDELSRTHTDALSRENFRLMKLKADREFFSKIKA